MLLLGMLCLSYAGYLFCRSVWALGQNDLKLTPRTKKPRIAVLIPARDESAVIDGLLTSIERQTVEVRPSDVYVIVEAETDPTVEICQQHHNRVFLRKDLSKQRKGYALDEVVKEILSDEKHYDLYFVFDADNILDESYLAQMLKSYEAGYEIATGYRNSKNSNANVIAAVSSLTFSMINVMSNRGRAKHGANIVFSGTGFYVVGELVEEWRGWPFHSLTEDYEMSLYATLHGLTTSYNETAIFYDEQPTSYRQTVAQRVRWIKGYFSARRKYIPLMKLKKQADNSGSLLKEIVGVKPAISAIVGVICLIIGGIFWLIYNHQVKYIGILIGLILLVVYLILMLVTIMMIRREKVYFEPKIKFLAIIFNPIYLVTYIPCALKALTTKHVVWKKIDHGNK